MGALYQLTSFTGFYKVMVTFLSPNQSHVYQRLSSKVHIHVYIVNPFKKQFVVFSHNKLSHISTLSAGFFFLSRLEGKGANEMTKVVHTEDGTNAHRFDHS